MDDERRVWCRENQGLADHVLQKKREYADKPKGLSKILGRTFDKAYRNVCDSKDPINTLKDLSQIKGVGKWMLNLVKGYFDTGAETSGQEDLPESCAGNKAKGRKRYTPRRNSVAYALLITLLRGTANGKEFMRKAELIAATEASGLSHAPVAPEKGKGKAGLGNSKREWDSGWSAMTTLILKGLVAKSSNPAKYMLTDAGREVANECITRSGLPTLDSLSDDEMDPDPAQQSKKPANQSSTSSYTMREEQTAIPDDILVKFLPFGYSKEQVVAAFREVSDGSQDKDPSTLCLSVMCHLRQAAKKKKRRTEPCNFCEFSSSRYGCGGSEQDQEHDNEAVLCISLPCVQQYYQLIYMLLPLLFLQLREHVEILRSQLMKMTGRDDDLSFTELQALKSRLSDARRIVLDQKHKKEREEEEHKKKAEDEDDGTTREVSVTNRHEKQDDEAPMVPGASMVPVFTSGPSLDNEASMSPLERKFESRKSESLQRKFERLWLFNERMNGREIESMTSDDLHRLGAQILDAIICLRDQMMGPRVEQSAWEGRYEFSGNQPFLHNL